MRFYGFTRDDPPEIIDLPISGEVVDLSADLLADWSAELIKQAVGYNRLDPTRPLGVAGGRLADDQDPRDWPELPEPWVIINEALRSAAAAEVRSRT